MKHFVTPLSERRMSVTSNTGRVRSFDLLLPRDSGGVSYPRVLPCDEVLLSNEAPRDGGGGVVARKLSSASALDEVLEAESAGVEGVLGMGGRPL